MSYIVLDFETYYDKDYSLRKMTAPEYLFDPRYETIGCAIVEQGSEPVWLDGDDLTNYLTGLRCRQKMLSEKIVCISHNALFDMCLLTWKFGLVPDLMIDTMSMARSLIFAFTGKVSLEAIAEHLGLPPKGTMIKSVSGLRAADIKAKGLWHAYAEYAKHDAYLAEQIFLRLRERFPREEYVIMDMVIRCAVLPRFRLDLGMLALHRADIEQQKQGLLNRCGLSDRTELMSNDKFADALRTLGIEPPTKTSVTTGLSTYAFAKTDPAMIELTEHPNPQVQALVAARVGHKSTLEETRTEKLLRIGMLEWPDGSTGWVPIPLRYSGAHTHRLSGDWKMNSQNWPKYTFRADGSKETGKIRRAHTAPEGHKVVKCDAAQIEARIVAWLAGQDDLTEAFRKGEDIYSDFAQNNVYHYPVNKSTVDERFVGKQCILGLGFQAGAQKFVNNLAAKSYDVLGRQIVLPLHTGANIVNAYRTRFHRIPQAWEVLKQLIPRLASENSQIKFGPVVFEYQAILLPNGHRLFYHDLQFTSGGNGQMQWMFKYGNKPKKLFGGKTYENIVQALARIITMGAAVQMKKYYPMIDLAHQVHDDLVYIVPDALVPEFRQCLRETMSVPPPWAAGLPLDAEDAVGQNYGDAK